jgi:hypothetical protein
MDWSMLWKEMAIGFLISGFLATLFPSDWWKTLFVNGGPLFSASSGKRDSRSSNRSRKFCMLDWQRPFGQRSVERRNQLWRDSLIYLCRPDRDPFDLDLPKILRDHGNFLYCPSDVYFDGTTFLDFAAIAWAGWLVFLHMRKMTHERVHAQDERARGDHYKHS